MSCVTRPILRWHGGKWRLAPWILSHFPEHRVYVEPYGGAGSVLMRKARSYAEIWNDLDQDLVTLFQVLRSERAEALIRQTALTPYSRVEFERAYEKADDPVEIARRLLVRSCQGFGGNGAHKRTSFRACSTRDYSIPSHDWSGMPAVISQVVDRLKGVIIECRPALKVMAQNDGPETLHFVDPPYLAETRGPGGDYAHELSDEDHDELLAFLKDLKGKVVLCGYPSEKYDTVLEGWRRVTKTAWADGVNCSKQRTEVLWMNFEDQDPGLFGAMQVAA